MGSSEFCVLLMFVVDAIRNQLVLILLKTYPYMLQVMSVFSPLGKGNQYGYRSYGKIQSFGICVDQDTVEV